MKEPNVDRAPNSAREQFKRTTLALGADAVDRMGDARVLIVGLGAVGSYAVEALARAGVGEFRLVDFDVVQESNINRQLFATHATLGRAKVDVARERILAINPFARVETKNAIVNDRSLDELFAGEWQTPPDFAIDAIDSLGPKVALIAALVRRKIPFASSMGAALRLDAALPSVSALADVVNDPLAAQVRKRLRRVGVDPKDVRCVYSPEPIRKTMKNGDLRLERVDPAPPIDPERLDAPPGRPRNTLGSLPTITGIFGLRLAHEAMTTIAALR